MAAAPERLAALLRAEGGLLGAAVADAGALHGAPGVLAAQDGADEALGLAVEAIREGYLLHFGAPRVLAPGAEADLALLAGDRLYALGLERLAARGDLRPIATLAEVIAQGAQAHAAGEPRRAADAWAQGTRAVTRQLGGDMAPGQ